MKQKQLYKHALMHTCTKGIHKKTSSAALQWAVKVLLLVISILPSQIYAQCSINAGGHQTICGTTYTLQGSAGDGVTGNPTWTVVSKPAGAVDPVFSDNHSYTPKVTKLNSPGDYVFEITQACNTGSVSSQVTITAPGSIATFTAGSDITNISALTGEATLNATIPEGYTASWRYYNLNSYEYNGTVTQQNATMTGTTTATPTLALVKKANHDIDPAYLARLRITSINNPSCWYEDDVVVRFIPNPKVDFPELFAFCANESAYPSLRYYYGDASIRFSTTTTNASANPANGTTITMTIVTQPAGGNLSYDRIHDGRLYFSSDFNGTIGDYVFKLTIANANGSFTTPNLTFRYNGSKPRPLSFIDAAYPEQMELYTAGNSAGAVYCDMKGSANPISIHFKLDPEDPVTLISRVTAEGTLPPGGAPSIVETGAGTRERVATLTPPTGGWHAGTYRFYVNLGNGTCNRGYSYYVHIPDGNRPNVQVDDVTVCYPGSGVVSATISLPEIYKGVVNSSYFQGYGAKYELTVVSKPQGSANPSFQNIGLRTITDTSTVISNLDKEGEYVFKIKTIPSPGGDPGFIEKEYACSGTSFEDTFSIFVSAQVGANAGSNYTFSGTQTTLNGNDPGVATGTWSVVSKPAGAPAPVFADPTDYRTNVSGFSVEGDYTFRWTIATGSCVDSDEIKVTLNLNPMVITNPILINQARK